MEIRIKDGVVTTETEEYVLVSDCNTGKVTYRDKKTGSVKEFQCREEGQDGQG